MPAPFCKLLSIDSKKKFHITKENTDCLFLYSQEQWTIKVEELKRLRIREGGERRLRTISDTYCTIEVDKNGRMTIPQKIREAAGLEGKVVLVGMFDYLEIWNFEKYEGSFGNM